MIPKIRINPHVGLTSWMPAFAGKTMGFQESKTYYEKRLVLTFLLQLNP